MYRLGCSEVWGGVSETDTDVESAALRGSLFARAAEGGKGGDIYYFSVCGGDMLTRVAIADVVGHGQAASNVAQWLYESLQSSVNSPDASDVLSQLNRLSKMHGLTALTTAAVAGFYRGEGKLYVSAAGHPPMLLKRRDAARWEEIIVPKGDRRANLPLGVHERAHYDQESRQLQAGDRLFLYTDGVLEAPNASRELFGMERLKQVLDESDASNPNDVKRTVLEALDEHTGGYLGHDDVTFMALEVN